MDNGEHGAIVIKNSASKKIINHLWNFLQWEEHGLSLVASYNSQIRHVKKGTGSWYHWLWSLQITISNLRENIVPRHLCFPEDKTMSFDTPWPIDSPAIKLHSKAVGIDGQEHGDGLQFCQRDLWCWARVVSLFRNRKELQFNLIPQLQPWIFPYASKSNSM